MQKKQSFKELLSTSFSFFYLHRFVFAKVTLIFFVVYLFLGRLIQFKPLDDVFYYTLGKFYNTVINISVGISVLALFLFVLAMFETVKRIFEGKEVGAIDSYKRAVAKFPSFIYVVLIYVLKVFSWSLLFIVPGIIFGLLYSGSFISFCFDGKKGEGALNFSKKLIKNSFNQYCDYNLFFILLIAIIFVPVFHILDYSAYTFLKNKNILGGVVIHLFQVGLYGYVINFAIVFYCFLYKEMNRRLLNA